VLKYIIQLIPMKLQLFAGLMSLLLSFSSLTQAQTETNTQQHQNHTMQMGSDMSGMGNMPVSKLSEAGNDAFGTIQEVITQLNDDPSTDWNRVDLEALRQHLRDMNDMTLNVEVHSQQAIENGMVAVVEAITPRAAEALARVSQAHPAQLQKETGWSMKVTQDGNVFTFTATTDKPQEVDKIRGLGYIGLLAAGPHHQPHHWAMATGNSPHAM